MNAYVYRAALWCGKCEKQVRRGLDEAGLTPSDIDDERTFDADDYPKGPYPDGGGEADDPQHCDGCGVFLKNPLTSDGYTYVKESLRDCPTNVSREWADFYGITLRD